MNIIEQKLRNLDQYTLEVYYAVEAGTLMGLLGKTRDPEKMHECLRLLAKKGLIEY